MQFANAARNRGRRGGMAAALGMIMLAVIKHQVPGGKQPVVHHVLAEDLDIAVARIALDRVPHHIELIGWTLESLQKAAILEQEHAGDAQLAIAGAGLAHHRFEICGGGIVGRHALVSQATDPFIIEALFCMRS